MSLTTSRPDAPVVMASNSLVPQNMDQAIRLAEMMARAKMVPQHMQGDVGTCLMVVEQSMRWNMSPFAVAQCTSNIKGKLMYEGKIVAAAVETSGVLDGLFDYQFEGEGQNRKIIVIGQRRGEREPRTVEVTLKDAQTDNIHWKRQPDQQLVYHGVRVWARRWSPAVLLGVYSPEEMDLVPRDNFTGTTIESTATPVNAPPPAAADPDAMTPREMADAILAKIARAPDEDGLHLLAGAKSINRMRDMLKEHAPDLDKEVADALALQFQRLRGEEAAA